MDLSSVGRAGLSAAIPVLSACGVQACGLPSALFSTHTGGFEGIARQDEAAFCEEALSQYLSLGVEFDAVYTGYLNSHAQLAVARRALALWPAAFRVVDPAIADDGELYSFLPGDIVQQMAALCEGADLITPNLTESAFLCGEDPKAPSRESALRQRTLLKARAKAVLLTSVPSADGGIEMLGAEAGVDFTVPVRRQHGHFPGTGDAFTSALLGLYLRGLPLEGAAAAASRFVEDAIRRTETSGVEIRQGVWLEESLPLLWQAVQAG